HSFNPYLSKDAVDQEAVQRIALRLYANLAIHCRTYGPLTHIIALPFLGKGGAERTALQFARAIAQAKGGRSVSIWITDRDMVTPDLAVPPHVHVVNLWQYLPTEAGEELRLAFLRDCLMTLRPDVFHVINSDLGWKLICQEGHRLRGVMRLYGSMFAFQFTPDLAKRIGYAEYYLRQSIDVLDGLLSDNSRFQVDAIDIYGLENFRQKFIPVYNACRIAESEWKSRAQMQLSRVRAAAATNGTMNVLWAGRLDEEKRVDLLYATAMQCPDIQFHVYGESVVGSKHPMPDLANLKYHGPFGDPTELVDERVYDAFLFTSRWEGMPNMLLEVGALGIPIIAPDVGGVGELIDETTGFLVSAQAAPEEYVHALRTIGSSRELAVGRAAGLLKLIDERHTWTAFCRRLTEVPNYL
ncbi:glycosyltransferase family 4 protein, partial [Cupriavidus oxalaticus]